MKKVIVMNPPGAIYLDQVPDPTQIKVFKGTQAFGTIEYKAGSDHVSPGLYWHIPQANFNNWSDVEEMIRDAIKDGYQFFIDE